MRKWVLKGLFGMGALVLVVTLASGYFALAPKDIETLEVHKEKPVAVKLPDPPKAEEPPPPPPQQSPQNSLLAELAPDSFANAMQDLGGVGFGSGGSGPAIAGGGGFGSDAGQLVKNQTSVDRPPRAVAKSAPEYPSEARSRGVSGFVVLKILVAPNGSIERVSVEESEPKGFFDQAALSAVRAWRFEPAVAKGQTVAAWTTQKIKFELN